MSRYISPKLREEIDLKMKKIADNPEFYDTRRKIIEDSLLNLGDIYSFWIEHPELRKDFLLENKSEKTIKRMAAMGIRAVRDGWYFLLQRGRKKDFVDVFTVNDLERLNSIVYRDKKKIEKFKPGERFRKPSFDNAKLNIPGYTVPSPQKIPDMLENLFKNIKETFYEDPLEAGIMAHLGIAAIQPFYDGNKRCARLVQNRILLDGDFPPSIIPAGESVFYRKLFEKAFPAYEKGDIDGQRQFYDFCASKVNVALDDILNDLQIKVSDLDSDSEESTNV